MALLFLDVFLVAKDIVDDIKIELIIIIYAMLLLNTWFRALNVFV